MKRSGRRAEESLHLPDPDPVRHRSGEPAGDGGARTAAALRGGSACRQDRSRPSPTLAAALVAALSTGLACAPLVEQRVVRKTLVGESRQLRRPIEGTASLHAEARVDGTALVVTLERRGRCEDLREQRVEREEVVTRSHSRESPLRDPSKYGLASCAALAIGVLVLVNAPKIAEEQEERVETVRNTGLIMGGIGLAGLGIAVLDHLRAGQSRRPLPPEVERERLGESPCVHPLPQAPVRLVLGAETAVQAAPDPEGRVRFELAGVPPEALPPSSRPVRLVIQQGDARGRVALGARAVDALYAALRADPESALARAEAQRQTHRACEAEAAQILEAARSIDPEDEAAESALSEARGALRAWLERCRTLGREEVAALEAAVDRQLSERAQAIEAVRAREGERRIARCRSRLEVAIETLGALDPASPEVEATLAAGTEDAQSALRACAGHGLPPAEVAAFRQRIDAAARAVRQALPYHALHRRVVAGDLEGAAAELARLEAKRASKRLERLRSDLRLMLLIATALDAAAEPARGEEGLGTLPPAAANQLCRGRRLWIALYGARAWRDMVERVRRRTGPDSGRQWARLLDTAPCQ